MQRNEFEIFCKENQYTIQYIKDNLKKIHLSNQGLNKRLSPFCNFWENAGCKKFIFLFAALLKNDTDFTELHLAFDRILALFEISSVFLNTYKLSFESAEQHRSLTEEVKSKFPFIPLIAYSICSYEKMQLWFNAYSQNEPMNALVKIIERTILSNNFKKYYSEQEWEAIGKENGIMHAKDSFLALLAEYATPYPPLLRAVESLGDFDFNLEYHPSCIVTKPEPLHEIMLKINSHHLQTIKIFYTNTTEPVNKYYTSIRLGFFHQNGEAGFTGGWKIDEIALFNDYKPRKS